VTGDVLAVSGLTRSYQRGPELVHALRDVSFTLAAGEVCALAGPSGSGKSTLLNIIGGWEHSDEGEVSWLDGTDTLGARVWGHMGLIPQRLGLLEDLTADENIELPLQLSGLPPDEVAERGRALMERLDIAHLAGRLPAAASLGEQQRICVARSVALDPRVILADEPTGNQDAARRELVFEVFRSVAAAGGACLVATHDPHVIEHCDRLLELSDGQLVSDRPIEQMSPWQRRSTEPTR
jgi:putative ABC transport system ATP-binding protein